MLKNLKSLFIVEDEVEASEQKAEKPTKNKTAKTNSSSGVNIPPPLPSAPRAQAVSGGVDVKIVEKLLQAIEKNNLEGFDYLEYKKSLKALEKMPMDEATKYRSAFATASTMGVTLDKLLDTVKFYTSVLDKEHKEFHTAFKGQFDAKVSGKEREIAQLDATIKEKAEMIKKLTEEITQHQQQISELKIKVEESNTKISKTKNDFELSYQHLKSQFEADITKMNSYLK